MKKFLSVLAEELRAEGKRILQDGEEMLVDEHKKSAAILGTVSGTMGALANSIEKALERGDNMESNHTITYNISAIDTESLEKTMEDSDLQGHIRALLNRDKPCIKCGSVDPASFWHKDKFACSVHRVDDEGTDREHLHFTCRCCGYSWTGPTKDAANQGSNEDDK